MQEQFLFTYGTLRQGAGHRMFAILDRFSDFVGNATYQGKLYHIGTYPGVVPSDDPADRVSGEVYRLRNPFVILSRLDRYEECGPGFRKPTEFIRQQQSVRLQSGQCLSAWVYVYNRPVVGLTRLQDGDFIN